MRAAALMLAHLGHPAVANAMDRVRSSIATVARIFYYYY